MKWMFKIIFFFTLGCRGISYLIMIMYFNKYTLILLFYSLMNWITTGHQMVSNVLNEGTFSDWNIVKNSLMDF